MAEKRFFALFIIVFCCLAGGRAGYCTAIVPEISAHIFGSQNETLHYSISWTGGVKIGDLYLTVRPGPDPQSHEIRARVTDYGLFHFFYPVNDTFATLVKGEAKLPYRYEVQQKEGWGKETLRLYEYDQQNGEVRYRKNQQPQQFFTVPEPVHNEFSSFFFTRMIDFTTEREPTVPTFADEKINPVKVHVKERETIATIYGERVTIPVLPLMKFKGLYDKAGDTTIWFGDDACRIPYRIRSKILIGSLTATLVEYENPGCMKELFKDREK